MYLWHARVANLPPFDELEISFRLDKAQPRLMTVLYGGAGVGKTSLLAALAATRPGHAVAQPERTQGARPPSAVCDWWLGIDDRERPHPLRVSTPGIKADDPEEALRRREQLIFDRVSREGGFAFAALSSARWFSRQPIALSNPARSMARYDVRGAGSFDDATRADLARETKQALAYAAITSALSLDGMRAPDAELAPEAFRGFGTAMHEAVNRLVGVAGFQYRGLDPVSLEPVFFDSALQALSFDHLPTRARHLVALAAIPTRVLWGAYPGLDPRHAEGVVCVDEADLHQDPASSVELLAALRSALPRVQWILTTASPTLAGSADADEVFALRRATNSPHVELFGGNSARMH